MSTPATPTKTAGGGNNVITVDDNKTTDAPVSPLSPTAGLISPPAIPMPILGEPLQMNSNDKLPPALPSMNDNEPLPSYMEQKLPASNHSRAVSWATDISTGARDNPKTTISLQDIMNVTPYETEAEAYILRTLDESHPSTVGPRAEDDVVETILGGLPPEATVETFTNDDEDKSNSAGGGGGGGGGDEASLASSSPSLLSSAPSASTCGGIRIRKNKNHKRISTSTANDLFSISKDLAQLHSTRNMFGGGLHKNRYDDLAQSDGDSFFHHADMIHRLTSKSKSDLDIVEEEGDENLNESSQFQSTTIPAGDAAGESKVPPPTTGASQSSPVPNNTESTGPKLAPGSKWKKVKTSVEIAGAINNTRKSVVEKHDIERGEQKRREEEEEELYNIDDSNVGKRLWMRRAKKNLTSNYQDFEDWLKYKEASTRHYIKNIVLFIIVPLTIVASILFYGVGNPPCGTTRECNEAFQIELELADADPDRTVSDRLRNLFTGASYSWWVLFAVRQLITLSLSLALQALVVEYWALRSRWSVKLLGPYVTLFIVQSKGWPMVLCFWSLFDFLMLHGKGKFASNWLFWQTWIRMMNARNPSGTVLENPTYTKLLICALVISIVVALKRFFFGLQLGKQTYIRYGNDLAKLMKKSFYITKVANLARDIEENTVNAQGVKVSRDIFDNVDDGAETSQKDISNNNNNANATTSSAAAGSMTTENGEGIHTELQKSSEREVKIAEILDKWEEPEVSKPGDEKVEISAIIHFREALSYLDTPYPFSVSFGKATTRVECIESSEIVYRRLLMRTPNANVLTFDTLALVALHRDGSLDEDMAKDLIRLFRPDRDGKLSLLDFAKSIDSVYKELRLLRANVISSSKLDRTFGVMTNILFYLILGSAILMAVDVNPMLLFASVSSLIVGFAFMIGAAASKYFEGLLFVLVRKPYNVGDRINVSNVNVDTSSTGSPGWIVKDVTLFTTTVLYAATNEVATYSNGSLAASRIINAARSPKANISFLFKFPIDAPYQRLEIFKSAIEKFVKARPREWISFLAFRSTRVEVDLGFVEYVVVAQHRESWANVGSLLTSKAELSSFALELMKQMKIRYKAPPMPVDLKVIQEENATELVTTNTELGDEGKAHKRAESAFSADNMDQYFGAAAAMFEQKKDK